MILYIVNKVIKLGTEVIFKYPWVLAKIEVHMFKFYVHIIFFAPRTVNLG